MNILIIERQTSAMCRLLEATRGKAGIHVTARSLDKAEAWLAQTKVRFDLVVTDITEVAVQESRKLTVMKTALFVEKCASDELAIA